MEAPLETPFRSKAGMIRLEWGHGAGEGSGEGYAVGDGPGAPRAPKVVGCPFLLVQLSWPKGSRVGEYFQCL